MARMTKAQRELAQSLEFRTIANELLVTRHNDWNDWELDWLTDEIARPADYIYTERERAVLDRLRHNARPFTAYAGYTVPELIAIAYAARYELDEGGQEFIEGIFRWSPTDLKRRQIRRLARICRLFATIEYDDLADDDPQQQESITSAA